MRFNGLIGLSLAALLAVAGGIGTAAAAWQPDEDETWRACDGQARPGSKAVDAGLRLVFAPVLALGSPPSPTLPPAIGLAEGRNGIDACRAAMSDSRSREWPERRGMQHFAAAVHLLDAVLKGEADPAGLPTAKAAWLSDSSANATNVQVRWLVEPYFDLLLAVAAAERGDPRASAILEDVIRRRPASSNLSGLVADASLSAGIAADSRRRIWWHASGHDLRRVTSAAGIMETQSNAYLPTRDMLRRNLLPLLHQQLGLSVYGNQGLVYRPAADATAEGYSAQPGENGQQRVSYRVKGLPATLAMELALFRAAQMAQEAGKSHISPQTMSASGLVMRQFQPGGLSVDSQPLEITVETLVVFANPAAEPFSSFRDPKMWLSVEAILASLAAAPLQDGRKP